MPPHPQTKKPLMQCYIEAQKTEFYWFPLMILFCFHIYFVYQNKLK